MDMRLRSALFALRKGQRAQHKHARDAATCGVRVHALMSSDRVFDWQAMATSKYDYTDRFYESQVDGSLRSARVILALLWRHYQPASVVDFGCGRGAWLKAAGESGASDLTGFDGGWITPDRLLDRSIKFSPVDMQETVRTGRRFDLALSVEVAEHLPAQRAESFVQDLCSASDVVLFGAAIPGQGGTNHVNEQPQSYWVAMFHDQGYEAYDLFRPQVWSDPSVEFWYRQNTFLFIRRGVAAPALDSALRLEPKLAIVDVVHPELLRLAVTPLQRPSVKEAARTLKRLLFPG